MVVLAWLFGIIAAVVVIAIAVAFLNRFYRKSTRDVALVRTGFGGQKIVLSGGCLALPFLHKVEEINMRTNRVEVRRTGDKSLITVDRIRVDVELEFYVRVEPTLQGVATAAQALGARSLNPEGIRNLFEGRFVGALQSVAAAESMDSLHEKRAEFVRRVGDSIRENLTQNGILLESVSLTRFDQAPFAALDENNAFNAVGMRKLSEIITTNKKKRTEIEAEADIAVRQTQLDATKQRLNLQREEEQAQIAQRLAIEKIKAASDAEAAKAREESLVASENARIAREKETQALEISKGRELRALDIGAQLNSEIDRLFPEEASNEVEPHPSTAPEPPAQPLVIEAHAPGYVQAVDIDEVLALAQRHQTTVWLHARPGDFVFKGTELAVAAPAPSGEDFVEALRRAYVLGADRTPWQDAEFAIQQLVEVALHALSPGINEPFTAITCIDRLGQGLNRLVTRQVPSGVRTDSSRRVRLIAEPQSFPHLLAAAFDPIALYAAANPAIYRRLLETLAELGARARRAPDRAAIREQALSIRDMGLEKVAGDRHHRMLQVLHTQVLASMDR